MRNDEYINIKMGVDGNIFGLEYHSMTLEKQKELHDTFNRFSKFLERYKWNESNVEK